MKEQEKKIIETGNTKDVEVDLEQVGDKVVGGADVAHAPELKRRTALLLIDAAASAQLNATGSLYAVRTTNRTGDVARAK